MDKTFAVIEKLKEVELELHRLKNYAEMMNLSVEAKREWQGLTKDEINNWDLPNSPTVYEFAQFVEAKLKEKNT